jgi:peroxiredoxin
VAFLLAFGCGRSGTEGRTSGAAKGQGAGSIPANAGAIGSTAPDFELTDLSGKKVRLSDLKGKVVILDFWATWCGPCRMEIPDLVKLQSKYGAKGLTIVGLTVTSPEKDVRSFAQAQGMNYPVLLDADDLTNRYGGIVGIPTTFVVDRQGRITQKFIGVMSTQTFEEAIQPLLAG